MIYLGIIISKLAWKSMYGRIEDFLDKFCSDRKFSHRLSLWLGQRYGYSH